MLPSLSRWLFGGGAAVLSAAGLAAAQPSSPRSAADRDDPVIELKVTRFWVPTASQTEVLAWVGVPYQLATPTGAGAGAKLSYKVTLRVVDDKGTELAMDSIRRQAPASYRQQGAVGMEPMQFLVTPGKYYLTATVQDSVTGKIVSDSIAFEGYTEAPQASDLLLTNVMRVVVPNDTTTAVGEIARGDYRLVPNSEVRIDLTRPSLAFMIEAYPKKKTQAQLTMSLSTVAGDPVLDIQPGKYTINAGGAIIARQIPLEGIPQGRYTLTASLMMDGKATTREVTFTVTDPETAVRREFLAMEAARRTDAGYFSQMAPEALDSAEEVLTLITGASRELQTYTKDLSTTAKRQFLIDFWGRRNPVKSANAENAERILFYKKIELVNKLFGENLTAGWRTDRGRIWASYGAPDDSASYSGGTGAPIVMWKWTRSRPFWVVFADKNRTRQYRVMKSLDDREAGTLSWIDIITPATVQSQVEPFVGKQFVKQGADPDQAGGGGGDDRR